MISAISFLFLAFFLEMTSLSSIIVMMIFLSIFIFSFLWSISGSCWFPLILCLLFVGGILVIFMVISSLFPNTKNYYPKTKKKIFFLFAFVGFYSMPMFFNSFNPLCLKHLILSGGNFFSMTLLILCYFFCFLYFISKDKISLRSFV